MAQQLYIWIPDAKEGFVLGTIVKELDGNRVIVKAEASDVETVVCKEDLQSVNPPKLDKCEDMSTLSYLNEASVLHNLRQRYYSSLIYTYSGLFCVVINPYKCMPHLYASNVIESYRGRQRHEMPPHAYAITDCAYRAMLHKCENQSILCTGESGAGKTENTKKVIQYLASVASSGRRSQLNKTGRLEEQLLLGNPILEAFGNSKTVKNDNSSRFGKFIRISFDNRGHISGANIEYYLLEKSRVIRQATDERSFHFFYQLLLGASPARKSELLLDEIDSYRFLTSKRLNITNIDDASELTNTLDAMSRIGFSDDDITAVMRISSAVLLLGNLSFLEDRTSDTAKLVDDRVAQKVSCLLGLSVSELIKSLLEPRIKVGRDYVHKSQTCEQVQYAVESTAKTCYERMFRWLIQRINLLLGRTHVLSPTFIGILDIAGFEIFDLNSFEQLCINYTNEKLQQFFNSTVFILEQEEYKKEGVEWSLIDFGLDLQPTIDLIEKPMGILSMLDEQCIFPKSTDKSFLDKLVANQSAHPKFVNSELRKKYDFGIIHYAGRVEYSAEQWILKNMDPLNPSVVQLLQNSSDSYIVEMWKNAEFASMDISEPSSFGVWHRRGMFRTVGQTYKTQLSRLMGTLSNTNPHFVRCIIPNHEKKAGMIDGASVLSQLRCNGVLEGIRICRLGYPNRLLFHDFRRRYEFLVPSGTIPEGSLDGKEVARKILSALDLATTLSFIGQSKVFFRANVIAELEERRDKALENFILRFQAFCRGYLARASFKKTVERISVVKVLQKNLLAWIRLRDWEWWKLFAKIKPLLEVSVSEKVIAEKENELRRLKANLLWTETSLMDANIRMAQLDADNSELQKMFAVINAEKCELEDVREMLTSEKVALEEELTLSRRHLEERCESFNMLTESCKQLKEDVVSLNEHLNKEQEECKMLRAANSNKEEKIKQMTTERDELASFLQKLNKEKQIMEGRLEELQQKIISQGMHEHQSSKLITKLEQKLADAQNEANKLEKQQKAIETEYRILTTDVREKNEKNEELLKNLEDVGALLKKKEAELLASFKKIDESQEQIRSLEQRIRELSGELCELKDDMKAEHDLRLRTQRGKRDCIEELEALKQELLESQDKTQVNVELRAEREKQYVTLKKELEEVIASSEQKIGELKMKNAAQVEELCCENESLKRQKLEAEKAREQAEKTSEERHLLAEQSQNAYSEECRKRKCAEKALVEWQSKAQDLEAQNSAIRTSFAKAEDELVKLAKEVDEEQKTSQSLRRKLAEMESELAEARELLGEQKNEKDELMVRLHSQDEQISSYEKQCYHMQLSEQKYEKEIHELQEKLIDLSNKRDELLTKKSEELQKKFTREIEQHVIKVEQSNNARIRVEKIMNKLIQENEDMLNQLEKCRIEIRNLEKKQRKFDQQLEEERVKTNEVAEERDNVAQELRNKESTLLSMAKETEVINSLVKELQADKEILQAELENAITAKDDAGRSALELARIKRELADANETIVELEDSLQLAEDVKLRLEVTLQSTVMQLEKARSEKDSEECEMRKTTQRKIRVLEDELEAEHQAKLMYTQAKRKLETEIQQAEERLEVSLKQKEEVARQLCKANQSLKDLETEMTNLQESKDAISSQLHNVEIRTGKLESELAAQADEIEKIVNERKNLKRERDSLLDDLSTQKMTAAEEKNRLHERIYSLEEKLGDEQDNYVVCCERLRKTQLQLESLTTELAAERSLLEKELSERQSIERERNDLKKKISEMETDFSARFRGQNTASENRIQSLNEQLIQVEQEKNVLSRENRRLEKKLANALSAVDEEKRNADRLKETVDRAMSRHRQMGKQIEELEEEALRERSKMRQQQRSIEAMTELNETLTRENAQLKSVAAVARRNALSTRASTSRLGSEVDGLARGTLSVGGDNDFSLLLNSASTTGSFVGDDNDLTTS